MKLRIRSNSLRLRLGPREVQTLLSVGSLEETLRLGPEDAQVLRYRLTLEAAEGFMSARMDASGIAISLSRRIAETWANDDGLTLAGEQPVGNGQTLQMLVEKDLQCIDSTAEPEQDVYPNPAASCT